MKNNKMMRLASGLLVLALLTACIISGTFAKYTSEVTGNDTAKVAKWGVQVAVSGSLFGENYNPNSATANQDEIAATAQGSVDISTSQSSDVSITSDPTIATNSNTTSENTTAIQNIVAPGTQNTKGLQLSITGTPEVANTISITTEGALKDIYLNAGTYAAVVAVSKDVVTADNYTNYYVSNASTYKQATTDTAYNADTTYYALQNKVTLNNAYYPIKWYLSGTEYNNTSTLFQSLKTKYNTSEPNNPNIELTNLTDTITWKWPYNGDDNADTILGDLITGSAVVVKATGDGNTYTAIEATDYSTEVSFGVKLTVSQVD